MDDLYQFNGSISALAGAWAAKPQAVDGYIALAKSGASAGDLLAYAEVNGLPHTLADCELTVVSVKGNAPLA